MLMFGKQLNLLSLIHTLRASAFSFVIAMAAGIFLFSAFDTQLKKS